MRVLLLAYGLLFFAITQASAEEIKQFKPLDIDIFGLSHHPNGSEGGKLDQRNYGLGLRYNFNLDGPLDFKPFLEADMLTNSNRGKATIVGGGMKNDSVFHMGAFSFGGGVAYVNIGYEIPKYAVTPHVWTGAAFLTATYKDWLTVNLAPVPKQDSGIYLLWLTVKHVW